MLAAVQSGQFRRDVKRAEKRGKDMAKLRQALCCCSMAKHCLNDTKIIRYAATGTVTAISTSSPIGC